MAKLSTTLHQTLQLVLNFFLPENIFQKNRLQTSPVLANRKANSRRRFPILFLLFSPFLAFSQTENCTNGLDDDADGLIDCYDQDCTCTGQCTDFYYSTCNADCFYIPPCTNLSLGIQWTATAETGTYATLVAGDLDADGVPEVVTARCEGPEIYIIDGKTGATKRTIIGPTDYPGGTAPALADLDKDGFGEIVLVGNDRILRAWNHDGSLLFASTIQVGYDQRYRFSVPSIADMDNNGQAEIIIGNQVFSGQTGALLASGGAAVSAGEHPARVAIGFSFNQTVAMDVLPDNFCPDCAGLEIVAGNQVLAVNLATGNATPVVSAPANYSDGFTSVADFDRDGDLDAIVQGKKGTENYIYVWDIQTPSVLREFHLLTNEPNGASRANVADLDGDGKLEVSFVGYPWLYALKNDFSILWINPTTDGSSITTCSVFDFCGDGSADVVYRSETSLQILEGATGQVKWQDACTSLTHIEAPLILDVDADGQTEVVIICGTNGSGDFGSVSCYEAVGSPGIASRKVWNQHAYFNTNINDDLSVPRFQQNPNVVGDGLELNTFLNQFFNPTFPAPDGNLTLENVGCDRDSLVVVLEICNVGDKFLPATTPVSFYKKNPTRTAAVWLGLQPLGFSLQKDSCRSFFMKIPRVANDSVFLVLNDNHSKSTPFNFSKDFPTTTIGECDFQNNMVGFFYKYTPGALELGKDTLICDGTTLNLNAAGVDFQSWDWQDGTNTPNFLISEPGTFSVTVTDVCGITKTDTRKVGVDSSTVVNIGADHVICAGENFILAESGFDFYSWKPGLFLDCTTCSTVKVNAPFSGNIILEAGFNNGCRNMDTIFVAVNDTFYHKFDTTVCFGRKVLWNNIEISPGEQHVFDLKSRFGCDSTVLVRVKGTAVGTFQKTENTAICEGKKLNYLGFEMLPGEDKIFNLTAITGCDSTVHLFVGKKDTFWKTEFPKICTGETYNIFGQNIATTGIYKKLFTAANGCDSTQVFELTVLPAIDIEIKTTATCIGLSDGSLLAETSGGLPPFHFSWNLPGETKPLLEDLPAGNYQITVTDANDCTTTADGTVAEFPPISFSVETDSVRCFGEKNGAIRISSADSTLLVGFDGNPPGQIFDFEKLAAGKYMILALDEFGCQVEEQIFVFQPDPLTVILPDDRTIELGDSIQLNIQSNATTPLKYHWSSPKYLDCDTCLAPISKPLGSFRYFLTVTDANGCRASDDFLVEVARVVSVFVPNVFLPTATTDGNTHLKPFFGKSIEKVDIFQVFDRWGNLVHEIRNALPTDFGQGWDGKFAGKPVQSSVLTWKMKVKLVDGTAEEIYGTVAVMR